MGAAAERQSQGQSTYSRCHYSLSVEECAATADRRGTSDPVNNRPKESCLAFPRSCRNYFMLSPS
ncbi:hypothetical protein BDV37DRAFT_262343 [Aspergillus pseudonomiae]|uniref:Uncharacterized protein n=1 Tax=Aspergillus pseudonomiae TaxID=1506151 RepID=A0A5N7CXU7_9EURO|nr:uncharacterized protein BDV37DRAFT_262343 [Aspergillus pseudonomiae]KAE8398769.1 hypothetical protein BDV37DRAFT_262343 [Aspergillus pseudonomiae]